MTGSAVLLVLVLLVLVLDRGQRIVMHRCGGSAACSWCSSAYVISETYEPGR